MGRGPDIATDGASSWQAAALTLVAAWLCSACGAADADGARAALLARTSMFEEVASVGAFVDANGRRACTGTVTHPQEVTTSARCAQLALGERLRFAASHSGSGMQRVQRAQVVGGRTLAAEAGRPRMRRSSASHAALQSLAVSCRVVDVLALGLSERERLCVLRRLSAAQLPETEMMGLGNWRDRAVVRLDQPTGMLPVGAHITDAAEPPSPLWVVGTRSLKEDAHTVHRYAQPWREVARNAHEIHAVPEGPVAWVDIGAGLFAQVGPSHAPRLALMGVASRPFVAHGDASAGIIFSRVEGSAAAPPTAD